MNKFSRFLNSVGLKMTLLTIFNIAIAFLCSFFGYLYIYFAVCVVVAFIMPFVLSSSKESHEYKATTFLLTLMLPFVALGYAGYFKDRKGHKKERKEWLEILYRNRKTIFQSNETIKNLKVMDDRLFKNYNYIVESLNLPCYQNVNAKYFSFGEAYFKDLFNELKSAKKYILVEVRKIVPGKLWTELFDILRVKAREGVNVKLIYDDAISTKFISKKDYIKMQNHGIETIPFNKVKRFNKAFVNYRNFKRIFVIDGRIAYQGGFDIDDSYVTNVELTPATKDCGVKLVGESAKNFIITFFEDYQYATKKVVSLQEYFSDYPVIKSKDWALGYSTNPVTHLGANKNIILNIIHNAKESISILTPYVVIDYDIREALIIAVKSGIKVRLIYGDNNTDKKTKHLARAYFYNLIREGVEVYEYKAGKMTSNVILVDDKQALISTANLNSRHYNRYFNCGVLFYGDAVVLVYNDIREIVTNAQILTIKDLQKRKFSYKVSSAWNRFFSIFK